MYVFRFILLICAGLLSVKGAAQLTVKQDLKNDWKIFQGEQYKPFTEEETVKTIYFLIDADKFSGDYLRIESTLPFSLFVNGRLATGKGPQFSIDSLAKKFSSPQLSIAIHQEKVVRTALRTTIVAPVTKLQYSNAADNRPPTFFRDFAIVALLILLLILIAVSYLNPKLASDYFSVTRVFSRRESDDGQMYTRISNSTNVLFYGFCSLILGFYLMIIFHFVAPVYAIANYFEPDNFFSALGQWVMLSFILLIIFFIKIILVYAAAAMFGSREIAGMHFFNWVRMLLIVFGLLSIILFTYFISRGQSLGLHIVLLKLIAWCLAGWIIIIFLKLNGRSNYSLFHLFSYICATEIIPLLVIITVLYK